MVVISTRKYAHVEKDGSCFHSLRAAGLAIELAHKLARDKGFGNVSANDLSHVSISGPRLRVCIDGTWRKLSHASSVTLQLQKKDHVFALEVFQKQRVRLSEMGLNVWQVDPHVGHQVVSPDLLADAGPTAYIQVSGFVAIELKLFSGTSLEDKIQEAKEAFEKNVAQMHRFIQHIGAGLLVVSIADWDGCRWAQGPVQTWLWQEQVWAEMGGLPFEPAVRRNRLVHKKPLLDVLNGMTWYNQSRGKEDLGIVSHFLAELGVNKNNVAERVASWQKAFKKETGYKLALKHVSIRPGSEKCWVGPRSAFRAVHAYL